MEEDNSMEEYIELESTELLANALGLEDASIEEDTTIEE
jgi:hypothetical protein